MSYVKLNLPTSEFYPNNIGIASYSVEFTRYTYILSYYTIFLIHFSVDVINVFNESK